MGRPKSKIPPRTQITFKLPPSLVHALDAIVATSDRFTRTRLIEDAVADFVERWKADLAKMVEPRSFTVRGRQWEIRSDGVFYRADDGQDWVASSWDALCLWSASSLTLDRPQTEEAPCPTTSTESSSKP